MDLIVLFFRFRLLIHRGSPSSSFTLFEFVFRLGREEDCLGRFTKSDLSDHVYLTRFEERGERILWGDPWEKKTITLEVETEEQGGERSIPTNLSVSLEER